MPFPAIRIAAQLRLVDTAYLAQPSSEIDTATLRLSRQSASPMFVLRYNFPHLNLMLLRMLPKFPRCYRLPSPQTFRQQCLSSPRNGERGGIGVGEFRCLGICTESGVIRHLLVSIRFVQGASDWNWKSITVIGQAWRSIRSAYQNTV